jgi:phosphoribosylaminoimidazole-succinocarboxamide synthase
LNLRKEVSMDPLTSIVTALAAGAAAALQSSVEQVVKDSYAALKGLIQRKYAQVSLDQLEANPSSKSRRGVVEEDLKAAGAETDAEVLQQAQALLEAIQSQAPETAAAIGVDLQDIEGAALAIRRVTASGAGVKVERGKFSGDIIIENVRAGGSGGPPPNP